MVTGHLLTESSQKYHQCLQMSDFQYNLRYRHILIYRNVKVFYSNWNARYTMKYSKIITINPPTRPNSSQMTAKIKSVCGSGRYLVSLYCCQVHVRISLHYLLPLKSWKYDNPYQIPDQMD